MLMSDHMTQIDHIVHDLEQLETSNFTDNKPMSPMAHTRILAKEVLEEFMALLRDLEIEEFEHSGVIYDTKMIDDMCLIACYISWYNHENLIDSDMTLEETCRICAGIIGCNPEALIHMKLNYDLFFENAREGSEQTIVLNADMIRILRIWEMSTEDEMLIACRKCLES